ncbi:MAG: argininosuccinate lyase [Thalassobaculum sp.]|uniref:argininosuccinate lyase n=1 Tax=Thalassobaculum sp. TaxID=2022740 RepID=UPI0032F03B9B
MGMRMWLGSVAIASSMAVSAVAWAQAKQDFTLVNNTGYALSEVYVSPSKADDWQDDILGRDIMDDGVEFDISFDRADKSCFWDLKVIYHDDNSSAVWQGIDLCTVSVITIKYNRQTDTTSAVFK